MKIKLNALVLALSLSAFSTSAVFCQTPSQSQKDYQRHSDNARDIGEAYYDAAGRDNYQKACQEAAISNRESWMRMNGVPEPLPDREATPEAVECNKIIWQAKCSYWDDKFLQAATQFGQAAEIMSKARGPKSVEVECILYRQAVCFMKAGKRQDAINTFEKAVNISIQSKHLATDSTWSDALNFGGAVTNAQWLNMLGECYKQEGNLAKAISSWQLELTIPEGHRNEFPDASVRRKIAAAYEKKGDFAKALVEHKKIVQALSTPSMDKIIKNRRKDVFISTGKYTYHLPDKVEDVALAKWNLAKCYNFFNDNAHAQPLYTDVLDIIDGWYTPDDRMVTAEIYDDYSRFLKKQGQLAQATSFNVKASKLRAPIGLAR